MRFQDRRVVAALTRPPGSAPGHVVYLLDEAAVGALFSCASAWMDRRRR